MSSHHGRRSRLPRNTDIAEALRGGETLDDIAAGCGAEVTTLVQRLNNAGWGITGHPLTLTPERAPVVDFLRSDLGWLDQGLCAQVDPEAHFPDEGGGSVQSAKSVCRRCPVKAECLALAIERDEFGVWGGTTRGERRKMRRGRVA